MTNLLVVSYVLLWIIVVVQALVLVELLRHVGMLRLRLGGDPGALLDPAQGLPRGAHAPAFTAPDIRSGELVTDAVFRRKPTALVFLSPTCTPCRTLAAGLGEFAHDLRREAQVIGVCVGPRTMCAAFARDFRLTTPLLLDETQAFSKSYNANTTPSAVLVDTNGVVRLHGIPNDLSQLEGLLREEGTPMENRKWLEVPVDTGAAPTEGP